METILTFLGGVIIGAGLGVFVTALCVAAGQADRQQEIIGPPNYKIPVPPKPKDDSKAGDDK